LVLGLTQKFKLVFSGGVFQISVLSGFQQASFQVCLFCSTSFLFISKVSSRFGRVAKTASRFFAGVLVKIGFDWLCFAASALFAVGFVGFQNRLIFFLQKFW